MWGEVRDRSKRSTDQLNEAYLRAAARPSLNEGWTLGQSRSGGWVGGGGGVRRQVSCKAERQEGGTGMIE
jgi:hypothetical protein